MDYIMTTNAAVPAAARTRSAEYIVRTPYVARILPAVARTQVQSGLMSGINPGATGSVSDKAAHAFVMGQVPSPPPRCEPL